jgi:3-dehydroquinate synthetase
MTVPIYPSNWKIAASEPIEFDIKFCPDIFSRLDSFNGQASGRVVVVIDSYVMSLYNSQIELLKRRLGANLCIFPIKLDESSKDLTTFVRIIEFFEDILLTRVSEPVYSIGGGVLLDVVAFACSVYRRGIPNIKIPTNLMAMIDASIGIKTGLNFGNKRNRIGTYTNPQLVLIDKSFLSTCSERHITNGLGEVFKIALIKSKELFELLEYYVKEIGIQEKLCHGSVASRILNLSISLMHEELLPNLKEKDLQRCVDFGHSISPLIELENLSSLLHGEAVALDCLFFTSYAQHLGYLSSDLSKRIYRLAHSLGLPLTHSSLLDTGLIQASLRQTYTHRNNNYHLPIPTDIGSHVFINSIDNIDICDIISLHTANVALIHELC